MTTIQPFLLFEGKAETALRFYTSLFPGSTINEIQRYGNGDPGKEGTISKASFTIAGQTVLCTDSVVPHPFNFTPAFSFFITCDHEREMRRLYAALAEEGSEHMPIDNYGFSRLFGWVSDKFGVSWQLNLP